MGISEIEKTTYAALNVKRMDHIFLMCKSLLGISLKEILMQYRLRVYGRTYRKVAYLDTQTMKESCLDQLAEKLRKEGYSGMFRVASAPWAAEG